MSGLHLQQGTSQRLTQVMQRAIGLLQMDHADLAGFLIAEAAENPCLTLTLPQADPDTDAPDRTDAERRTLPGPWRPAFLGSGDEIDTLRAQADGLHAHVARQIGLIFRDARARDIAMIFLEHLEPSGWLGAPLEDIARQAGCSMAEAEAVLTRLHEVEPAGLFARSLAECLRLQLEEAGELTLPMARLLDALPLLAKGDTAALLSRCEVDAEELAALVTRLRRLDPKPGSHFDDAPELRRAPDLIAERDELGQWHVALNSATAPRIAITPHGGAEHRTALKEARWLERTVSRRNALVLDVAAHVLSVQREFLEQGPVHLKPLSCADVAEKLGVHETTINRVRNGLLIQTPRGMMSMRAFFARGGTGHRDGSHVPAEAISARIADLIAAERPDKPLTDQQLATRLAEVGLRVSRRTVSNRRRMAGFPNAAERQISKGREE
ncbi:RNA polymerase factor sigma-54 [Celeribacter sp. HF31]|uniref:RNA polymerase factor sigma-54 n=1 Tax=Celeribacter sp. HF31 TaxID=2721558 RepID=UPI001431A282|nr:RNA polymerase factor sigma-54 [Celeribacter sp. HF31]NIY81331.1 RNA polymerase factor sigma-54 [Celeribacter sp. HF31]